MRPLLASLLALALVVPLTARAAEPRKVRLNEVERGFFVGSSLGAIVYPSLPGKGGDQTASGAVIGIEAGVDLLPTLQLGVLVLGQAIGADVDYDGIVDTRLDPKGARGDFQSLLGGATLRFSFLQLADDNGIDRTFFYARAAGGVSTSRPRGIVGDGVWASAGLGIEYFTRLRHFSIGLEVDGVGMKTDEGRAIGVAVLPRIAYTF